MTRSVLACFFLFAGCGDDSTSPDTGRRDGGAAVRDAGQPRDAGRPRDASVDSGAADAGADSGSEPADAGTDAAVDASADSGIEAIDGGPAPDAGDFCIPMGLSCAGAIPCCDGLMCCGAPVFPPGFELCFEMCP